jgi:hypothetical protein
MDNNNILAKWLALQTRVNSDNIELARLLIPSLPEEELELNLMIAYYGNIWFQYNENYSEFLSEIDNILVARGISVEPKIWTINFNFDSELYLLEEAFEKTIDTYKNRIDEAKLYKRLLYDYGLFWVLGRAFAKYQEKASFLLNYTLDDWRFLLRKYKVINELNQFCMPCSYDNGAIGPTPDFIYDLTELTSFKTFYLSEISPKITQLINLEHISIVYCFFDSCQTLDLRHFLKLQILTIELRSGEINLIGGEQLQEFDWHPNFGGKIRPIPEALRNMTALKVLHLHYPAHIGGTLPEFQQLTHLYISHIYYVFLNDKRFLAFRRCKYLQINCYKGKHLPDSLQHFTEVEELSIDASQLTIFPTFMIHLPKLRSFKLYSAQLRQIDMDVVRHLLTHLQSLQLCVIPALKENIEQLVKTMGSSCQVVC